MAEVEGAPPLPEAIGAAGAVIDAGATAGATAAAVWALLLLLLVAVAALCNIRIKKNMQKQFFLRFNRIYI